MTIMSTSRQPALSRRSHPMTKQQTASNTTLLFPFMLLTQAFQAFRAGFQRLLSSKKSNKITCLGPRHLFLEAFFAFRFCSDDWHLPFHVSFVQRPALLLRFDHDDDYDDGWNYFGFVLSPFFFFLVFLLSRYDWYDLRRYEIGM